MIRLVLDLNGIIGTLEAESDDWVRLLRYGITHQVELRVTSVASAEVAEDHDAGRRSRRMRQVQGFPSILDGPSDEVEGLVPDIYTLVFGTRSPTSRSRPNREADARHLAESIVGRANFFITLDKEILDASERLACTYGIQVRTPEAVLFEIEGLRPVVANTLTLPNILIRLARGDEYEVVRGLVDPISASYPEFDEWFRRMWEDSQTTRKAATVNGRLAAISVSKPKGADGKVVKLSTFFVGDADRDNGVGQHLMFHEIRDWARRGVRKVMVTVSSRDPRPVDFFRSFGFFVEGVSPRRYEDASTEIILARHFLYGEYDAARMPVLARAVAQVFGYSAAEDDGGGGIVGCPVVPAPQGPEPVQVAPVRISVTRRTSDDFNASPVLSLSWGTGENEHRSAWGELEIETRLYPVRLAFEERDAFIVPIQMRWAKALFEWWEPQLNLFRPDADKRFLRVDNVYYFRPRHSGRLRRGSPVLFYVTAHRRSAVGIVGSALVESIAVEDPESLFIQYGDLGIYKTADIREHLDAEGRAMAIRFTWFEAFERPVALNQVKRSIPRFNPISTVRIAYRQFENLRLEGGLSS
ncbi:MAG: hypothetical protein KJ042_02995 [Deltaproteobacteria bacterium]|nr:hypothetical protein [Deltaproteobacteria bacterium]